jgi:hypothetical protein
MTMRMVFLPVLLSLAVPVHAGNLSYLEQIGEAHSAQVQQGGTLSEFSANAADIKQTGQKQDATLIQQGSFVGENAASIVQTGAGNAAAGDQSNSDGTTKADILQSGGGNGVTFVQSAQFGSNQVLAAQAGEGNKAEIHQIGGFMFNSATLDQKGADNTALIKQGAGDGSNIAVVVQDGAGNDVTLDQHMHLGFNTASITLVGLENTVTAHQFGAFANGNQSDILAHGDGNHVDLVQGDDASEFLLNSASIEISGNHNTAKLRQTGISGENSSAILIEGGANMVSVTQSAILAGGGNPTNASVVSITGNGNVAVINQSSGP